MTEVIEQEQDVETPEPTLRDELEAAFEQAEEPVEEQPETAAPENETAEAKADRLRDEKGRFAPKQAKADGDHGAAPTAGVKPVEGTPSAGPPVAEPPKPQEAAPVEKAPQSWKPVAREHWASLPADVRAEVQRREREVAQTLQESAESRKGYQSFREAVGPFEAMIRAEGSDPVRAVASLLQTAAALRTAPPVHRAQMIAQMVQAYSVPIEALDAALAGQPMPQGAQHQGPMQDPRVDQLLARMEAAQRQQQQAAVAETEQLVESFSAKHEFFEDVREDMADIMEIATKRGQKLSLDDAYNRAVAMHPEFAKALQQREALKTAATARAATQRARAAASSVKPSAAVAPRGDKESSLREQLEEAFDGASGR